MLSKAKDLLNPPPWRVFFGCRRRAATAAISILKRRTPPDGGLRRMRIAGRADQCAPTA